MFMDITDRMFMDIMLDIMCMDITDTNGYVFLSGVMMK